MRSVLKLTGFLVGGLLAGMVFAGEFPEGEYVILEKPGIWNEARSQCSCYPYSMVLSASDSREVCTAPYACYEERYYTKLEKPGIWSEASSKCNCYPYSMVPGASDSEEACTAPSACYEERYYTKEGELVPASMPEEFVISGSGYWAEGFIGLQNEDGDTGIHFYDDVDRKHRIWNNNGAGDILRISPLFAAGGITIDQGGKVAINWGNNAPQATLDVNGIMRLKVHSSAPGFPPCGSLLAVDGLLALTSNHTLCVCSQNAGGWVRASNGSTACTW